MSSGATTTSTRTPGATPTRVDPPTTAAPPSLNILVTAAPRDPLTPRAGAALETGVVLQDTGAGDPHHTCCST